MLVLKKYVNKKLAMDVNFFSDYEKKNKNQILTQIKQQLKNTENLEFSKLEQFYQTTKTSQAPDYSLLNLQQKVDFLENKLSSSFSGEIFNRTKKELIFLVQQMEQNRVVDLNLTENLSLFFYLKSFVQIQNNYLAYDPEDLTTLLTSFYKSK